jgi:hypothetical protein
MPRIFSIRLNSSEISTEVVPTRRLSLSHQLDNFLNYRIILFALGFIYEVLSIVTNNGTFGWGNNNIQFVYAPDSPASVSAVPVIPESLLYILK